MQNDRLSSQKYKPIGNNTSEWNGRRSRQAQRGRRRVNRKFVDKRENRRRRSKENSWRCIWWLVVCERSTGHPWKPVPSDWIWTGALLRREPDPGRLGRGAWPFRILEPLPCRRTRSGSQRAACACSRVAAQTGRLMLGGGGSVTSDG